MEKMTRLTIDIPSDLHRQIKSFVGFHGITLREFVLSQMKISMQKYQECPVGFSHVPNKETIQAFKDNEVERRSGNSKIFDTKTELFHHLDTLEKEVHEEG